MNNSSIQLFPYFQPIVSSASGEIAGYEALARQRGVDGHVKSAGELFLHPDISDHQLRQWDRCVRRQALERFSELNDDSYLTLNISAAWIDYIEDFERLPTLLMLEEFEIAKNRIVIEITETRGNLGKLLKAVAMYREQGLRIAIDDFGAGFSQLERVIAIQPDIIKLDMRLFQNAARGGIETDVVHLLTRLAKRTGCRIVCEGVETDEDFLFGLNCGAQYMQGYLFSPATADFQEPKRYSPHITRLRDEFLTHALRKQEFKNQFNDRIRKLMYYLQKKISRSDFAIQYLSTELFKDSGLLHFYICDKQGNQITPNFNFLNNTWVTDTRQMGFNWAWRPYFYETLSFQTNNRVVASERYRDFSTDMLCKTFVLRLDENRILLVDVVADWA
jgi:EAL domain-containing protein (putative c-di-GMP-specific phosphodiesterase class I)